MGVKFSALGGGDTIPTTFSDNFTRANKSTLGYPWVRNLANAPGGAGNGATASGVISANTALFTSVAGAGPANVYIPLWLPSTVYNSLFTKAGVFVQFTFQAAAGAGSGSCLRFNTDLNNTATQSEGADYYICVFNGRIDKRVGGGAQTTIGANTIAQVAGDVLRFECLNSSGNTQVALRTFQNGVIVNDIVDSTATRILTGAPGLLMYAISATGQTFQISSFSCGPISALTPGI